MGCAGARGTNRLGKSRQPFRNTGRLVIGDIAIFASGASTVSPLFRILDSMRGTLIVDEGDFRFSDEKAELVKILNNGNGRGFPVLRSESVSGKEFSPRAYSVFGPKLIATRGDFHDRAWRPAVSQKRWAEGKLRDDVPINLDAEYKKEALELRNKVLMFRFRNFSKCRVDPTLVDRSVEPRLAQVFVPLLSVIEDAAARQSLRELMQGYPSNNLQHLRFHVHPPVRHQFTECSDRHWDMQFYRLAPEPNSIASTKISLQRN